MTTWRVDEGNCRTLMAAMDEASIDSIVTDPPYELTSARPGGRSPATEGKVMKGFMGMEWDGSGVAFDPATWAAALRVLKPGGMLVAFSGARTYHRMACAIEDAGFEIRDQIMWIYGSGFPKGGNRDGKGTCLKPAHEPIVLARKPLIGSVARNEAAFGTGVLNIDVCRIATTDALGGGAEKETTAGQKGCEGWTRPWMDDQSLREAHAARVRANVEKAQALGRWPANVIHDGSDEVLAGFPETSSGALNRANITAANRIFGAAPAARSGEHAADSGSAARFFYSAKASKADRDEGLGHLPKRPAGMVSNTSGQHLTRRDEGYEVAQRANHHPTVKPEAVMRWLVRLVTPVGGLVLDPFTGSGSTGKAAILEGRSFFGCELTAEYVPIARARIAAAAERYEAEQERQGSLFGAAA